MASSQQSSPKPDEIGELRRLLNSAPALIHTGLPDGHLDFFNQTWLEYVGRSLEDLQGWKWTAAIHPDDVEGIVEVWRASLASGKPFLYEARVRRADGEYRWMLHHKVALRDEHGRIVKWHGSSIDIEDRRQAEERLRRSQEYLAEAQELSHTGSFAYVPASRKTVYWSEELFRIFGLDPQRGIPDYDETRRLVHPDDRDRVSESCLAGFREKVEFSQDYRLLLHDGTLKHLHVIWRPVLDEAGDLVQYIGTAADVTDRKTAEEQLRRNAEELQRSEFYLAEGQRLAHMGSWAFDAGGFYYWSPELFRIHGLDPASKPPSLQEYLDGVHPQDRESMAGLIKGILEDASPFDATKRIVRPDGEVRYVRCVGVPLVDNKGLKRYVGSAIDVTEQELLARELRRREAYLAEAQRLSHTGSFGWRPDSGEIVWSEETYRIFEYDRSIKPTIDSLEQRIHPEGRTDFKEVISRAFAGASEFEHAYRLLLPDGRVKHVHTLARGLRGESGSREFVGAVTDVTERKTAEDKIREQQAELRQILDLAPWHVAVLGADGKAIYLNKAGLDYHGLTREAWQDYDPHTLIHPDDHDRILTGAGQAKLLSDQPFEIEARLLRKDGEFRWFLFRFNPLIDEEGRITRWYVTSTDIEDRRNTEQRLQNENVALREEIDKASMFEEIVGTSPALKSVLSRISKVAPSDSTVLITGETGTGKELVARAIHRRSGRASRAFVSVNCAAVPRDLIASELFGHEKGAFTGALQRRIGRFELAEGGTIFLDEVGDLPAETQVALLRVLQEREFERVGGNQLIRANVRVISATNRDLEVAIGAGSFRRDLFYRLSVFPIESPRLQERKVDIPMLVEYFIDRYARKAGKRIRNVEKSTMELLLAYSWPGNIRELQNVMERSVILCDGDTISVDPSWLSLESTAAQHKSQAFGKKSAVQEKEAIEAALAKSGGRVSGPAGAAAALEIPASTLESKIRTLGINKFRFKHASQ